MIVNVNIKKVENVYVVTVFKNLVIGTCVNHEDTRKIIDNFIETQIDFDNWEDVVISDCEGKFDYDIMEDSGLAHILRGERIF